VLLSVLLRQEQVLNHIKNQETKGHLNSWSNTKVRKLDQNVARRSECSSIDQKVVLIQAKNLKNIDQGRARHMNICPGKYICIDQSSNKGIYKDYVKKDIQCSFKTMNIDVLGKFHKGILS